MLALLPFLAVTAPPLPPSPRDIDRLLHPDCSRSHVGEVVVCGRKDTRSPYRIPAELQPDGFQIDGSVDSVSRERHKMIDDVGASGIHSCSPGGAGGWTGCMVQDWQRADQQRGYRRPDK